MSDVQNNDREFNAKRDLAYGIVQRHFGRAGGKDEASYIYEHLKTLKSVIMDEEIFKKHIKVSNRMLTGEVSTGERVRSLFEHDLAVETLVRYGVASESRKRLYFFLFMLVAHFVYFLLRPFAWASEGTRAVSILMPIAMLILIALFGVAADVIEKQRDQDDANSCAADGMYFSWVAKYWIFVQHIEFFCLVLPVFLIVDVAGYGFGGLPVEAQFVFTCVYAVFYAIGRKRQNKYLVEKLYTSIAVLMMHVPQFEKVRAKSALTDRKAMSLLALQIFFWEKWGMYKTHGELRPSIVKLESQFPYARGSGALKLYEQIARYSESFPANDIATTLSDEPCGDRMSSSEQVAYYYKFLQLFNPEVTYGTTTHTTAMMHWSNFRNLYRGLLLRGTSESHESSIGVATAAAASNESDTESNASVQEDVSLLVQVQPQHAVIVDINDADAEDLVRPMSGSNEYDANRVCGICTLDFGFEGGLTMRFIDETLGIQDATGDSTDEDTLMLLKHKALLIKEKGTRGRRNHQVSGLRASVPQVVHSKLEH